MFDLIEPKEDVCVPLALVICYRALLVMQGWDSATFALLGAFRARKVHGSCLMDGIASMLRRMDASHMRISLAAFLRTIRNEHFVACRQYCMCHVQPGVLLERSR